MRLALLDRRGRRCLYEVWRAGVLYSRSTPSPSISAGGTTIQPRRQPVIRQALEKLFTPITRSSGVTSGRNDGALAPEKLSRS